MASASIKYLNLFNIGNKLNNSTSFSSVIGEILADPKPTLRCERYGNAPLFNMGVLESADVFVLRTVVLAYLWPQFFVPFIAYRKGLLHAPVSAVVFDAPKLGPRGSNPRVTVAPRADSPWAACVAAADQFVRNYYDAAVPVAGADGELSPADPVARAVAAVFGDFQALYEAQNLSLRVVGLATMYASGHHKQNQSTMQEFINRMVTHMDEYDDTPFYGLENSLATSVSVLGQQFDTERLTAADDVQAAQRTLVAYLTSIRFLDVGAPNAAGIAALAAAVIPALPAALAPVTQQQMAARLMDYVHKLARISYFNEVGSEKRRPGLYDATAQLLMQAPRSLSINALISTLMVEKSHPIRGASPAASSSAPAASAVAKPSVKRVRKPPTTANPSEAAAAASASSSSANPTAPSSSSSAAAPLLPLFELADRAAEADRLESPNMAVGSSSTPEILDPRALSPGGAKRSAEQAALSYGDDDELGGGDGILETDHVSSPAQMTPGPMPGIDGGDDDEVMYGVFDVDNFWTLLAAFATYGHPFAILRRSADAWLDTVIGWYGQAVQASHDAFAPPIEREFLRRAGVGTMLADVANDHLRNFAAGVLRVTADHVPALVAVLVAQQQGPGDVALLPLRRIATQGGLTGGPIRAVSPLETMQRLAAHTFQAATDAINNLEEFAGIYDALDPLAIAGIDYWTERANRTASTLRLVTPSASSSPSTPAPAPAPALYDTRAHAQSLLDYARERLGGAAPPELGRIGLERAHITGRPASAWISQLVA